MKGRSQLLPAACCRLPANFMERSQLPPAAGCLLIWEDEANWNCHCPHGANLRG